MQSMMLCDEEVIFFFLIERECFLFSVGFGVAVAATSAAKSFGADTAALSSSPRIWSRVVSLSVVVVVGSLNESNNVKS